MIDFSAKKQIEKRISDFAENRFLLLLPCLIAFGAVRLYYFIMLSFDIALSDKNGHFLGLSATKANGCRPFFSRVLAGALAAAFTLMLAPLDLMLSANEEEQPSGVIMAFEPLPDEVAEQEVSFYTALSALPLPTELTATVRFKTESVSSGEIDYDGEAIGEGGDTGVLYEHEENEPIKEAEYTEETVSISVSWECAAGYDPEEYGTYVFTPLIPKNYTLAPDAELPEIIVSVSQNVPYAPNAMPALVGFTSSSGSGIELDDDMILDVVFVIDRTGSMQTYINRVIASLESFAQRLDDSGISVRFGLVDYADVTYPDTADEPIYKTNFTSDVYLFIQALRAINVWGGGDSPESTLEGIMDPYTGGRSFADDFRPNANVHFIVVTDAPLHTSADGKSIYSIAETVEWLNGNEINLTLIGGNTSQNTYQLVTGTDGNFIPIINPDIDIIWNILTSFAITYHGEWEGDHGNPTDYEYGIGIPAFNIPVRSGYEFIGWYDAEKGGNRVESISPTDTGDKELWAAWNPPDFKITYHNVSPAEHDNPERYTLGFGLTQLNPPAERTGRYTFLGWFDKDLGEEGAEKIELISDSESGHKELYAWWEAIEYNITYHNITPSEHNNPTHYIYGIGVPHFNAPQQRTGYVFVGWYNAESGGEEVKFISGSESGNRELWARFRQIRAVPASDPQSASSPSAPPAGASALPPAYRPGQHTVAPHTAVPDPFVENEPLHLDVSSESGILSGRGAFGTLNFPGEANMLKPIVLAIIPKATYPKRGVKRYRVVKR